jgi:phospholipase C
MNPGDPGVTRRSFVLNGAGALAAGALGVGARRSPRGRPAPFHAQAMRTLGRSTMRLPGSLPNPALPAGVDTMPEIEHIVVLMMENHSYDNLLGMLGREAGGRPRGDGFAIGSDGLPTASNPYPDGSTQSAFRMPTTCQLSGKPTQEWEQGHIQYDGGRNDGFVISQSGPVAMGYWTGEDLPFTYDLATQFPIGDRWFCSLLGQTDPNRRYLIAATSTGMTDDIGASLGGALPDVTYVLPSNGTIFTNLSAAGISWIDYYTTFPVGTTAELYPVFDTLPSLQYAKPIAQFFTDAAAGTLPSVSLLDPNYDTQSQEDPQNIVVGETFLARVVQAVGGSPGWRKTMLIITYDEHGGYYDHVPPPPALAPDAIAPIVQPGESTYDGFARYGFRVPSIVVSPYAKRDYVSHVVYDHTSILAMVERKWNLPAMTYRDANANDLTDFLDLRAMARGQPTFPELPPLAASGETAATLACSVTGPGTIPPPPAPVAASGAPGIFVRYLGRRPGRHALLLELHTSHGTLADVIIALYHGTRLIATAKIAHLSTAEHHTVLRVKGKVPPAGQFVLDVREGSKRLLRRKLRLGQPQSR